MGKPDLFAKRTFADRTEPITGGAASWQEAPEIGLEYVQSDGIIVIRDPARLRQLSAPWSLAPEPDEIVVELKMQGDHVDLPAVSRILLRRQARETYRIELTKKGQSRYSGRQALWLVSAYVPQWAMERYDPLLVAQGCYCWANEHFTGLWIASNELALRDELAPFLITRTGKALREFLAWQTKNRSWPFVKDLLRSLPMLAPEMRDFIKYEYPLLDDEEKSNVHSWIYGFLEDFPDIKEHFTTLAVEQAVKQVTEQAKQASEQAKQASEQAKQASEQAKMKTLAEARDNVLRILQLRKLEVLPEQVVLVEGCNELERLHLWRDRAVTAASAEEALTMD